MSTFDLKDKRILYQLDLDARQSLTQIGKKVNLPKNVVQYRIKRLEEEGIIQKYYTVIDTFKLGYISFRIYYSFQYIKDELQKEIIDYFVKNTDTYWIASTEGRYNLVVIIWVKDPCRFYTLWQSSLKKYRDYFNEKDFSFYFQLLHFRNSYLLDEYDIRDRETYEVIGCGKTIPVDDLDKNILAALASDARLPITALAEKTHSTIPTVNSRLNKLIKSGVIKGFRTEFDITKLGFQQFKVDIELKDYNTIDAITDYLKKNPYLYYITKTAGHADLEPTFRVKQIKQMHEIMDDLSRKFPGSFKNYNYLNITKMHKLEYMPAPL